MFRSLTLHGACAGLIFSRTTTASGATVPGANGFGLKLPF